MCNVIFMINILAKQVFGSFPLRLFFNVVVGFNFISLKHVGSFAGKKAISVNYSCIIVVRVINEERLIKCIFK